MMIKRSFGFSFVRSCRGIVGGLVIALAGFAGAGTTEVSDVANFPTSGGAGTIRYTGPSATASAAVTLTPAVAAAATVEVPAGTALTLSNRFEVTTGAFIKSGAGTLILPYVGSYSLGQSGAATANAALTWNDGNAVNGFESLTVADGTLEVGAKGTTVTKGNHIVVGVRHDCATDPMLKIVGGKMSAVNLYVDRGTSSGGKRVTPTLVVTNGAVLVAENWNGGTGGAAAHTNNSVVTVSGTGTVFEVSGWHTAAGELGVSTLNVTDGATFRQTRNNMDDGTAIGLKLGNWDDGSSSGREDRRMLINVSGGTCAAYTAYLFRYSGIRVTDGGQLRVTRPIRKYFHDGIEGQRGFLHFDNGTIRGYAGGVANLFCGITNYTVGAGGMTVDGTDTSILALSGHGSYASAGARAAGAEIKVNGAYVALGAGEVPIRAATGSDNLHLTVNGRHLGSSATGRILPADDDHPLRITVAGDNALQEMTFKAGARTRFRHQGIEADLKRWATTNNAMPMANGTLVLGHQSEANKPGAAWLREKLPVDRSFKIAWTYYGLNTGGGFPYGMAAVFQNAGLTSCGSSGSDLCFNGIGSSVGIGYDVLGKRLRFGTNGEWTSETSATNASSAWADDPMRLTLTYDVTTHQLVFRVVRPTGGPIMLQTNTVDLASVVGANRAYFGFTGGTGKSQTGYHCIDDVRIDAEGGRGYQKVGGHIEIEGGKTWSPEILADAKNLGFTVKSLTYGADALAKFLPSMSVGFDGNSIDDINLGFDSISGTGVLKKDGAAGLALSAPGAATNASVEVLYGHVILRHEELEEPPFSAADGDWCFTGPEIYWVGSNTLQIGYLGNGSSPNREPIHVMNANTRRRYRVDGNWKATFSLYGEAVSSTTPYQGCSFVIHNAAAGCEARANNLCGGFGGTCNDSAAAFRFWTKDNFVSYTQSSKWTPSATAEGSVAIGNGLAFTKGSSPIRVELVHDAANDWIDLTMTQDDKTFTYRWTSAALKAKIGNKSLAYLGFGAMGRADDPTLFRVSDFRFQYLDAAPAAVQPAYFGALATSRTGGLDVRLESACSHATYLLANTLALGAGSGVSVRANRAAGLLDLGNVTCAGTAFLNLYDGCAAAVTQVTGAPTFTVSGGDLTVKSATAFPEDAVLYLTDGARLNLAFDGTLKVHRIFVDGVRQTSGDFGSGEAAWIAGGTGRIQVGNIGLMILVR